MCVIVLVNSEASRPSVPMIDMMWAKNGDGGGAAWREADEAGDPIVCWEKGLMKEPGLARMQELAATLPVPFVLHMRIATIGGVKANMTHPFPIDERGNNELKGWTKGYVLFHNGTFKDWDKEARSLAVTTGIAIPTGKWSDSRAMAWICSIIGNGFMEFLPEQKGLAFGPSDCDMFTGATGWDQVVDPQTQQKVWCSNSHFLTYGRSGTTNTGAYNITPYCDGARSCTRKDINAQGKCPDHSVVKALMPPSEVGATQIPFPPTPKDSDDPQGPILSVELAARAVRQGRIGKNFLASVTKAHARMRKGGKDGDRARRSLIVAAAMPSFSGLRP